MIKSIGMGLLMLSSVNLYAISIYSEYMNSQATPQVHTNLGIGIKSKLLVIPFTFGIEYISFNNHGTIHESINKQYISKQDQWAIPIGIYYQFTLVQNLWICLIGGIKLYSTNPINNDQKKKIEEKIGITQLPLVKNYSETLNPHSFYKIELSIQLIKKYYLSFSKSWNQITNTIQYTALDQYPIKKKQVFSYDPISISVQYHF